MLSGRFHGTAMGTRVAPSVANLVMYRTMKRALDKYPLKPLIWRRFIDDIFVLWTHGEEEFHKFAKYLNTVHSTIKFTHEFSFKEINFLDTTVKLVNGDIVTDLYVKPTDTHSYLSYDSAHMSHCKTMGPYSQLLRIKRICTNHSDFLRHQDELVQHYTKRGYPKKILRENIRRAETLSRSELLAIKPKETIKNGPKFSTYC